LRWRRQLKCLGLALALSWLLGCHGNTVAAPPFRPLHRRVVVVDAGHGGIDAGSQIAGGVAEKTINLQLALQLRDALQRMGATVILTRESDVALSRENRVYRGRHREDLTCRVQIINSLQPDVWISLHCNSAPGDTRARGAIVYYHRRNPANATLARAVQNRLNSLDLQPFAAKPVRHKPVAANYFLLRNSQSVGVLVEAGYLSNATDLRLLQDAAWQRAFAENLALGIWDYLRVGPEGPAEYLHRDTGELSTKGTQTLRRGQGITPKAPCDRPLVQSKRNGTGCKVRADV
jgi:N-acetylmuramoyl-L-alanine amidase